MSGKAVGRTAAALPWLCPNSDSLIRLAEAPVGCARLSAADPAMLAFLLRFVPTSDSASELFPATSLTSPTLPETAFAYLRSIPGCWIPQTDVARRCLVLSRGAAALAARLAKHTLRAPEGRAFAVAALAPLGWFAVLSVDPAAAIQGENASQLLALQTDVWGFDQNAIARRLAHRWHFPNWAATALGCLNLDLGAARRIGADEGVFAVAQFAVLEAERREGALGLTEGVNRGELLKELSIDEAVVDASWAEVCAEQTLEANGGLPQNPRQVPLLPNLLRMAVESRRRGGAQLVARLEDRLDEFHAAVAGLARDADRTDRTGKLAALAELAAGAGHEINNPLAVISGNAQRLFRTEPEPARGESLQTIIRQTQRIAGIVRDLMLFARPPRPSPQRVGAADLLASVRDDLAAFAAEKNVRLELGAAPVAIAVRCDTGQIKHALAAIVRNGIEAAGADGWVRIGCAEEGEDAVGFVVEDSGPGLTPEAREHCFDPFYCGRAAGRGRGLGLSTAWQLARQNGGDVAHASVGSTTRFVLTVPRSITLEFFDRQSA